MLFFNGLARTTATPAAFLHDTLVIWVVLLAGPFLHERAARWNIAAIALLVGGEVALSKGIGHLAWGSGTSLVLAATLLWAVEVVVAKKLLSGIAPATVSLVRMGVGSAALLAYLAVEGSLGSLFSLNRSQLGWVLFTGRAAGRLRRHMDDCPQSSPGHRRHVDPGGELSDHRCAAGAGRGPAPGAGVARAGADHGRHRVGGLAHAAPRDGDMSDPVADPLRAGASRSAPTGPLLFARYAYPPNELGYCGPSDPGALLESASDGLDLAELAHLATGFAGAWPYLELIAGCNGIADPLDARVVEAYWVGNQLLEKVPDSALLSSLSDRFEDRAGRRFGHVASAVPLGGVCQHSFHVFAVYPWLGLLRAGMEGAPLTVLDRCRIRWGYVEAVTGDLVTVRNRLLGFDGSRLVLGPEEVEVARRSLHGVGLAPPVTVGDTVSLHWDWVCDRLTPVGLANLARCTAANLAAVNALPTPGPAAVCGA